MAFSRHGNDIWVTKETEGTGKTGEQEDRQTS